MVGPPATGRFAGSVPTLGRSATPPPGLSTCWPPLPRKSGRGRFPATILVLPKRCCTFTLLYRTPRRCAGLCCQIFPFNGLTMGRFTLIAFLCQLIPPPQ